MDKTVGVVLAAGLGKRMRSGLLKVLHRVGGVPMLEHVVEALRTAGVERCVIVVGHQQEAVRRLLGGRVEYAVQEEQLGTGHAALQARPLLGGDEDVVVLYGDTPLITPEIIGDLVAHHRRSGAAATLLTVELSDPRGYGRIVRDREGRFERIVEEADASPEEAAIREVNPGIYCFRAAPFFTALEEVRPGNAQGEFYLVDAISIMRRRGLAVEAVKTTDADSVRGVNTRADLAAAEAIHRKRVIARLWEAGVTVVDPATTFVDARAHIGADSVIMPFTFISGATEIGIGCEIGPGAHVFASRLGDGVRVLYSVIEESEVGDGCTIGPYSHLRAGSRVQGGARIGNFVELKNSTVGAGSKVPHHSYLGDASVGQDVNIGAGVVTVNYNGREKNPTFIGDGAFIGCNANLIAPVRIEAGGYVAAGSTIDQDVPSGALAIARARQENKPGWAEAKMVGRKEGAGADRTKESQHDQH